MVQCVRRCHYSPWKYQSYKIIDHTDSQKRHPKTKHTDERPTEELNWLKKGTFVNIFYTFRGYSDNKSHIQGPKWLFTQTNNQGKLQNAGNPHQQKTRSLWCKANVEKPVDFIFQTRIWTIIFFLWQICSCYLWKQSWNHKRIIIIIP